MDSAHSNQSAKPDRQTALGGLLRRRLAWRLTGRGWAVLVLTVLVFLAVLIRGIHPFLAVNAPVDTDVLVVEGWAGDYALRAAAKEAEIGHYRMMCVAGGPLERGLPLSQYETYAALGASVLKAVGVPEADVHGVPAAQVQRDRTYASALAVREWFKANGGTPPAINLVTVGAHARRSRLLYEKAFGDTCRIGVICVPHEGYDARRWWDYSQGVREVISESAAYLYVRLLFEQSADSE